MAARWAKKAVRAKKMREDRRRVVQDRGERERDKRRRRSGDGDGEAETETKTET